MRRIGDYALWDYLICIIGSAILVTGLMCVFAFGGEPSRQSVQPVDRHITQADSVAYFYAPHTSIIDAYLLAGKVTIVYRQTSTLAWRKAGIVGSVPDKIWQDVYVARGDSIVFERRIEGRIVPPETTPERIEWGTK